MDPSSVSTGPAAAISPPATPDLDAVKAKQQATWSSGDYAVIGTTLQIVGETLCEAADVSAGERVLDVACGNGNAALAAARRYAAVTGLDYVPALLERARARAAADGLALEVREGDAEAMPFADASFDVVLSTFGVMFAPDQARAARELARVCRPGGRIALASWTPDGFVGRIFKIVGRHVPPPPGVRPPAEWGTEPRLSELFDGAATRVRTLEKHYTFRYRSPAHFVDVFRAWYGPIHRAFASLPPERAAALEADLTEALAAGNVAGDGTLAAPAAYLEAVISRA
jgi:ubiquinone/menaquinone biosynthesis C-methylase UbiE